MPESKKRKQPERSTRSTSSAAAARPVKKKGPSPRWLAPLMLAIVVGGLGFPVITELWANRRKRHARWSVHTTLTVWGSAVLVLLGKDMRRRLRAEQDLADALAFRKAMEDSLVTGLRARDLQGRITYVNPAFCQMVGFSAEELLGNTAPAPYWPP